MIPASLKPFAQRLMTRDIPPLADADRDYLVDCFRSRNAELAQLTGLSLDRWLH